MAIVFKEGIPEKLKERGYSADNELSSMDELKAACEILKAQPDDVIEIVPDKIDYKAFRIDSYQIQCSIYGAPYPWHYNPIGPDGDDAESLILEYYHQWKHYLEMAIEENCRATVNDEIEEILPTLDDSLSYAAFDYYNELDIYSVTHEAEEAFIEIYGAPAFNTGSSYFSPYVRKMQNAVDTAMVQFINMSFKRYLRKLQKTGQNET